MGLAQRDTSSYMQGALGRLPHEAVRELANLRLLNETSSKLKSGPS